MVCKHLAECIQSIKSNRTKYIECELQQCLKSCDTRNIIAVEEHRKRYILQNNGDIVAVYRVDGQMIESSDTTKCDNMIVDVSLLFAILVEFKGQDLRHALDQIETTYSFVLPTLSEYKLYGRIITSNRSNVPNLRTDPQYIRIQKAFMKHGGNLKTQANSMSECVNELA